MSKVFEKSQLSAAESHLRSPLHLSQLHEHPIRMKWWMKIQSVMKKFSALFGALHFPNSNFIAFQSSWNFIKLISWRGKRISLLINIAEAVLRCSRDFTAYSDGRDRSGGKLFIIARRRKYCRSDVCNKSSRGLCRRAHIRYHKLIN